MTNASLTHRRLVARYGSVIVLCGLMRVRRNDLRANAAMVTSRLYQCTSGRDVASVFAIVR